MLPTDTAQSLEKEALKRRLGRVRLRVPGRISPLFGDTSLCGWSTVSSTSGWLAFFALHASTS